MKRLILLCLALLLSLAALAGCADPASVPSGNTPAGNPPDTDAVPAPQPEHTAEEQAIIDKYYQEMCGQYPSFASIPRENLREIYYRSAESEYFDVRFQFCLGGVGTGCECRFATSPRYPEGKWDIDENEFSRFYDRTMTGEQMADIRHRLYEGVESYYDRNHLKNKDGSELTEDSIYLVWQYRDGKFYASTEQIGYVTLLTVKKYGCGDHAHVFGNVEIDFDASPIRIGDAEVTGS